MNARDAPASTPICTSFFAQNVHYGR
jgi:hypothetical protein